MYLNICCSVLLYNVTKNSKEAVSDPTWVLSTIATRYVLIIL